MAPNNGLYHDVDLPDPESSRSESISFQDKISRHQKLLRVAGVAATLYSLLHKVGVPLFLKFTDVTKNAYKEIDSSWVWAVFFCCTLFVRGPKKETMQSLGAGAAIALGFHEVHRFVAGENMGWLAMSRLLSSGPMAVMGALVLITIATKKNLLRSWAMTALVLFVSSSSYLKNAFNADLKASAASEHNKLSVENLSEEILEERQHSIASCGVKEFHYYKKNELHVAENPLIEISECGFSPLVQYKNSQTKNISVVNQHAHSMNVHLWIYSESLSKRKSMNFVLSPGQSRQIEMSDTLVNAEHILFVSDSQKGLGMGILVDESVADRGFYASEIPARIKGAKP